MVKFFTQTYTYDYPFPTVTLAYFLRYPNPFSTHVLSTDVIENHFDPSTQRLSITRLHLKRSKAPSAVLRLIPRSLVGANGVGDSETFILERSTVDVREGWMRTESRNLEWTGVLSVVERQLYRAAGAGEGSGVGDAGGDSGDGSCVREMGSEKKNEGDGGKLDSRGLVFGNDQTTAVESTVTFHSRFGQRFKRQKQIDDGVSSSSSTGDEKVGFFRSWSNAGLQRSIEAIGLRRAVSKSQPNAIEGMKVVLERLREGGFVGVLEGMRRDREQAFGEE